MTLTRKKLISLDDTPYYHCVCRCVRRAFLWGTDYFSGQDYSHRKQWVVDRLSYLQTIFAIDICAYAVMSNHYHVVLHVDKERAQDWSTVDIVKRWTRLFGTPVLVERYLRGQATSQAEADRALKVIAQWRERLHDISWFMRCLNENLARRANQEDNCKGRFWEGRFKSQALLDEAGLLTCMAYVDLNPFRAKMASTPAQSEFTSVYERIQSVQTRKQQPKTLQPFKQHKQNDKAIPFYLTDYLQLVDWTGRAVQKGKRGAIENNIPPLLERLNINPEHWLTYMQPHGNRFGHAIGHVKRLRTHALSVGQMWLQGTTQSKQLFN